MMTTTVHTNISSTSVDGITVLRVIMVDSSDCSGVGVVDTIAESMVPESMVPGFSIVCVACVVDELVYIAHLYTCTHILNSMVSRIKSNHNIL